MAFRSLFSHLNRDLLDLQNYLKPDLGMTYTEIAFLMEKFSWQQKGIKH